MPAKHKRILIAEDNQALRAVLLSALSERYEVHEVGDGFALEEALKQRRYDLLITDLNLPLRSGTSVLRRTDHVVLGRQRIDGLGVPALVITGMDPEDEDVASVRRMVNVLHVYYKPLDVEVLLRQVAQILEDVPASKIRRLDDWKSRARRMHRMLVVDDDPDIRDLLSFTFEPSGVQVRAAATVQSAFQLCLENGFDLILLDYVIGDEVADGFLKKMQQAVPPKQRPPVLVVSGFEDALDMEHFRDYPQVRGIVSKPFDPAELFRRASQIMAGEQDRQRNAPFHFVL